MPRLIVKADRHRDLYCEWSTIVDGPTWIGDRAAALEMLRRENQRTHPGFSPDIGHRPEDRVGRADQTGTSDLTPVRDGAWDDSGFVWQQRGWLPRGRLADALDWMLANDGKDIPASMLDPFEDPDDLREVQPADWEREGSAS